MKIASHILLATDFSDASQGAVTMAGELARTFDTKLTVLNVHAPPAETPGTVVASKSFASSVDLEGWFLEALEELRNRELCDIRWLMLATTERGLANRGICDYAREHDVDLIVLGTHARSGLTHFFLGSVAEKVVKHAPCAVIVVPPAGPDTPCAVTTETRVDRASSYAGAGSA